MVGGGWRVFDLKFMLPQPSRSIVGTELGKKQNIDIQEHLNSEVVRLVVWS